MHGQAVHPVVTQEPPYVFASPAPPVYGIQPVLLQPLGQQQPPPQRNWNSGLCACCDDVCGCLLTYFCADCELCCCLSSRMDEHCCTRICLGSRTTTLIAYRVKLRARYNIKGSILDDCCLSVCCSECVQCQIKRELDYIEQQMGCKPVF